MDAGDPHTGPAVPQLAKVLLVVRFDAVVALFVKALGKLSEPYPLLLTSKQQRRQPIDQRSSGKVRLDRVHDGWILHFDGDELATVQSRAVHLPDRCRRE